jgi:hypothetical protein
MSKLPDSSAESSTLTRRDRRFGSFLLRKGTIARTAGYASSMAHQIHEHNDGIEELRKVLPSRSSIKQRGDGYEIVISSNMDEPLTFFVTFPKKALHDRKGRPAPTDPQVDR